MYVLRVINPFFSRHVCIDVQVATSGTLKIKLKALNQRIAVAIFVSAMDHPSSIFQQCIHPVTGASEWVLLSSRDDDGEACESAAHGLVHTSYLDMLNDTERNKAYEMAIKQAVRSSSSHSILDIGAGTGLLSMMAARALQEALPPCIFNGDKPIIACEAFLPMFRLAHKVISMNGLLPFVRLVHKMSVDMDIGVDMISRADILVSEILDSTLLGEGLIPTIQHAHDKLLKPNACVIPYKATIYGQLVHCDYLWRQHDLYGVELIVSDGLVLHPPKLKQNRILKPMQYPMHVDPLIDNMQMMSNPFKVFEFDLSKRPDDFRKVEIDIKTTEMGVIHAVISWWVLQLDEKGTILYSTAPKWIQENPSLTWRDHWKQCVWFVPGRGVTVMKDTDLTISASHDTISFAYNDIFYAKTSMYASSLNMENNVLWKWSIKPERSGLLGSSEWRSTVMDAMKKAVHGKSSCTCLVVDDSLPFTISAALASNSIKVISLLPGLQSGGSEILEYLLEANNLSFDQVKIMKKRVNELSIEDFNLKKVDILVGEPYYRIFEDMVPWRNLRFWKERTYLDACLSENFITIPCKGILRGMALSMHDLWRSRKALRNVQGFDHSSVNVIFGACGDMTKPLEGPILPYHLWQCGAHQELTEPFSLMTLDFSKTIENVNGSIKVQISKSGICHGIVLWIDWVLDMEGKNIVYTGPQAGGPTHWRQGVKLLPSPVQVEGIYSKSGLSTHSVLDVSASFVSDDGDLHVTVEFAPSH